MQNQIPPREAEIAADVLSNDWDIFGSLKVVFPEECLDFFKPLMQM